VRLRERVALRAFFFKSGLEASKLGETGNVKSALSSRLMLTSLENAFRIKLSILESLSSCSWGKVWLLEPAALLLSPSSSKGKHIEYLLVDSATILMLVFRVDGDTSIWTEERLGVAVSGFGCSSLSDIGWFRCNCIERRDACENVAAVGVDEHVSSSLFECIAVLG